MRIPSYMRRAAKWPAIVLLVVVTGLLVGALGKPPGWKDPIRPALILKLAEKAYSDLPKNERLEGKKEFCREYADGFFMGFTEPESGFAWVAKKGGHYHGFNAGQKYLKDHPESLAPIMRSYGYEEVEVVGDWHLGFEVSALHVEGKDTHSPWSLSQIFDVLPDTKLEPRAIDRKVATLLVRGFLSPVGRYGHMARYEREIHVTSAIVKETPKSGPENSKGR